MNKKIYRNKDGAMICGVLNGFADYFNIDVTLLRVIVILLFFFTQFIPVTLAYFILALIMPKKSECGFDDYTVE